MGAFIKWAFTSRKGRAWPQTHLAAVAYFAKLQGVGDSTDSFYCTAAMKGWGRVQPRAKNHSLSIDFQRLEAIQQAIDGT